MGYYAQITYANLVVPAANFEAARQAILDAGLSGWAEPEEEKTLPGLLSGNDFDHYIDEDGSLELQGFDNKYREQGEFIQVLGGFANEGWIVQWRGEEGEGWEQDADGEHSMALIRHDTLLRLQNENREMRALLGKGV